MIASSHIGLIWRRTVRVATAFWGLCLVLMAVETAFGANLLVSGLYLLTIPILVGCLTWAYRGVVFNRPGRHPASVLVLGLSVLASSSFIVFVGLLAAASLKTIVTGA